MSLSATELRGTQAERDLTQDELEAFQKVARAIGPVRAIEEIALLLLAAAYRQGERGDKVGARRLYDESLLATEAAHKIKSWRRT